MTPRQVYRWAAERSEPPAMFASVPEALAAAAFAGDLPEVDAFHVLSWPEGFELVAHGAPDGSSRWLAPR